MTSDWNMSWALRRQGRSLVRHYTAPRPTRDQVEAIKRHANQLELSIDTSHPVASGVGPVERRVQANGQVITTVYPRQLGRRSNLRLPNVFIDGLSHSSRESSKVISKVFTSGLKIFNPDIVRGIEMYSKDGFQKIRPYFLLYDQLISPKHAGMTVLDFLKSNAPFHHLEWLRYRIQTGSFQVNLEQCQEEQVLKEGDYITSLSHVHEHPVLDAPIQVIHEDDDLVVVNKPPSFVVQPHGGIRCNSLMFTLYIKHGYDDLRNVHRLDKLTSGTLICAKGPHKVHEIMQQVRTAKKEYLALVDGEFPTGLITCNEPLTGYLIDASGQRRKTYAQPKPSKTVFERLHFDGKASLVKCSLHSGRTHQVRLHLLHLGHPVINDELYNPRDINFRMSSVDDKVLDEALEKMKKKDQEREQRPKASSASPSKTTEEWLDRISKSLSSYSQCINCQIPEGHFDHLFLDKTRMFMCLHAWKYSIGDRKFEADLPLWLTDPSLVDAVYKRRESVKESE